MAPDAPVDSSTTTLTQTVTNAADLFYKDPPPLKEAKPEADSTTADISETPVKEVETETDPEPETPTTEATRERGTDGKFRRSDAPTRIKHLLYENKRLAEQLAAKAQPLAGTEKPASEVQPTADAPPEPGQFQTWDDYRKAEATYQQKLIDTKVKEGIERDRAEQTQKATAAKQQLELAAAHEAWTEKLTDSRKLHADFDGRVFDDNGNIKAELPLHPVFDAFIPKSKAGAEILYYLAGHLEEAKAIAKMEPLEASGEFHRLQTELSSETPLKTKTRPPATVTGNARPGRELSMAETFYGKD